MATDSISRALAIKSRKIAESTLATGSNVSLTFATPVTLPADEDVQLTNIGTHPHMHIQLGIPKGKDGMKPSIYHANLSTPGSLIEIPIGVRRRSPEPKIILKYQYVDALSISLQIKSAGQNTLIDLKRSTQYEVTGVEGSSINNMEVTSKYQNVDATIFYQSNEMHRVWIRVKDPDIESNLWSLFEVCLFASANAARTDIWVYPIYENVKILWN